MGYEPVHFQCFADVDSVSRLSYSALNKATPQGQAMAESSINKSVLKALEILEFLDLKGPLGVTEISNELGMDKSSVFRALNTLKSRNFVRQESDTLKYCNSYKLLEMGNNVARQSGLIKTASSFLRQLSRQVSGAVCLGVRDGLSVIYIDKIESETPVRASMKVGQSLPLYCTAMGKSILAFMAPEKLNQLLGRIVFEARTPNTHRNLESLKADLVEIRRRGYSLDDEEHIPGLFCVAAPIFNSSGQVIAGLSVANVKMLIPEEAIKSLAREVMRTASELSATL